MEKREIVGKDKLKQRERERERVYTILNSRLRPQLIQLKPISQADIGGYESTTSDWPGKSPAKLVCAFSSGLRQLGRTSIICICYLADFATKSPSRSTFNQVITLQLHQTRFWGLPRTISLIATMRA